MGVSGRLKEIRIALGLTQSKMAVRLNLKGGSTYSWYEKGTRGVPLDVASQIVSLGVDADWLLRGSIIPARISFKYKQLREEHLKLTIEEFSKKLGKPVSFMEAIEETGNVAIRPSEEFIKRTGETFGFKEGWIYSQDSNDAVVALLKEQLDKKDAKINNLTLKVGALTNELKNSTSKKSSSKRTIAKQLSH